MATQSDVNEQIVKAMTALSASDKEQTNMTGALLDKVGESMDLLAQLAAAVEQMGDRLAITVELVTTHVDNHE